MDKMLRAWLTEAKKLETGESTKEEYDDWRYKYPELDTHQIWAKVPSQELFDMLEKELKNTKKGEQTKKLIFLTQFHQNHYHKHLHLMITTPLGNMTQPVRNGIM